ncbi:MAG: AtpZ/AtpI family protein [Bacteroidales bacterium]
MSQEKPPNRRKNNDDPKQSLARYARYSSIAFQMVAVVVLFVLGGVKLDALWKAMDFPLATLVGAIVGVVLALYYSLKDLTK